MAQSFDIKYYDGKSTRGQAARLFLRMDAWEIQTIGDETQVARIIRWPLKDIHPNETQSESNNFHFGEFPHQIVECRDSSFPQALKEYYPEVAFFKRHYSLLGPQNWVGISLTLAVLLGLMLLSYFWALPKLAEQLADNMPREYEISMGDKLAESILSDLEVDSIRSAALQDFSKNIDFQSDYPLRFYVVNSTEFNAFAMPGGSIVVFDSLLSNVKNAEALAGLLGHEVAHVKQRHTLKSMARSLSRYLFVSLIFGDVNGLVSVIVENANMLQTLSYSRELEQESDRLALETLDHNHLDQHGMVDLLKTLQSASGHDESKGMGFLSTHPLTQERIQMAQDIADRQGESGKNAALEAAFEKLK